MRSADRFPRLLAALAVATLAGCASVNLNPFSARTAPAPAASGYCRERARAGRGRACQPGTGRRGAGRTGRPGDTTGLLDADAALAALRAGRTADAEQGFRALAQSDPDLAGPHANLGLIARNAGRLPEAVSELERATQLDPQQPVAWNQLGIAYRQQGQFHPEVARRPTIYAPWRWIRTTPRQCSTSAVLDDMYHWATAPPPWSSTRAISR